MISYKNYAEKVEELERYSKEAHVLEKENTRLKELNREMVEAIKQNCDICYKERDLDVCEECVFDKFVNEGEG